MKIAFISDEEIIPFDSIEAVQFEEVRGCDTAEIFLNSKKSVIINHSDNANRFKKEYSAYLELMAKATLVLEDL